jgi:hypothetical protein
MRSPTSGSTVCGFVVCTVSLALFGMLNLLNVRIHKQQHNTALLQVALDSFKVMLEI